MKKRFGLFIRFVCLGAVFVGMALMALFLPGVAAAAFVDFHKQIKEF